MRNDKKKKKKKKKKKDEDEEERRKKEEQGRRRRKTRPNFFLRSSRIRVDLPSYESKTTDKRGQYDWRAEKNLDEEEEEEEEELERRRRRSGHPSMDRQTDRKIDRRGMTLH